MNELLLYNEWLQFLVFCVLAILLTIGGCIVAYVWGGVLDRKSERDEQERLHERDLK